MQIEVIKGFGYSYHGWDCVEYQAGAVVEVPDECGTLAIKEGWAREPKAKRRAPETAAADGAPETK